jgi:hypothetical protein
MTSLFSRSGQHRTKRGIYLMVREYIEKPRIYGHMTSGPVSGSRFNGGAGPSATVRIIVGCHPTLWVTITTSFLRSV